jgi:lipoate-protein ligase A
VAGCGKLEISMDVEEGKISGIDFWGDYFGNGDPEQLQQLLLGCRLEESMLKERLSNISIGSYFHNLDIDTFVSILLE